jgi:transposase
MENVSRPRNADQAERNSKSVQQHAESLSEKPPALWRKGAVLLEVRLFLTPEQNNRWDAPPAVLQLISEVGTDMTRWTTEKHFASWHGLAGGRKQSGKRKGRVKAHRNRAGRMFCATARSLAQSVDKALGGFYRRLRGRVGGLAANIALARKLALLFYRLLRYGMDYVEKGLKAYEARVLETEARLLRKLAKNQGFILMPSAPN